MSQKSLPCKPKRRGKKQPGNAPQFDLRTHLYRISGVDFTAIDGLGTLTVLILLSEVGLDPTRFPTLKHFTSTLVVCAQVVVLLVAKLKALKLGELPTALRLLCPWLHKLYVVVILLWVATTVVCSHGWARLRQSLRLLINWHAFFTAFGHLAIAILTLVLMPTNNGIETAYLKILR